MAEVRVHAGSRMSFTGTTRLVGRLGWRQWAGGCWHAAQRAGSPGVKAVALAGAAAVVVLLVAVDWLLLAVLWAGVTAWYVLIFGVFGPLVFPWRLLMRRRRRDAAQREALISEMRALWHRTG